MYSTEKVTEPTILDKSLSSLEETITSAAETAVCLPSKLEKNLAYKWSNKLLVCLLEARGWKCKLNKKLLLQSSFYLVLPESKSKFIHSFQLFFIKMERNKDKAVLFQLALEALFPLFDRFHYFQSCSLAYI